MALLMMLPFVVLLLAIAFVPFVYQAWWEAHFRKVASFLGGVIIFYYLLVLHDVRQAKYFSVVYVTYL